MDVFAAAAAELVALEAAALAAAVVPDCEPEDELGGVGEAAEVAAAALPA